MSFGLSTQLPDFQLFFFGAVGVIGVTFVEGGIRFQKNEHDVTHAELWQGCNNASSIGDTILDYTAFIGKSVVLSYRVWPVCLILIVFAIAFNMIIQEIPCIA